MFIDRWYDRHSRNWIIQLKDDQSNEMAPAIYVYDKKTAMNTDLSDFPEKDWYNHD